MSSVDIVGMSIDTMNRISIPSKDETIIDDIDIDKLLKIVRSVGVYLRNKNDCPFGRGNWVIDFFKDTDRIFPIFCMKLPLEMKEEEVMRWIKPLMDKLKEKYN